MVCVFLQYSYCFVLYKNSWYKNCTCENIIYDHYITSVIQKSVSCECYCWSERRAVAFLHSHFTRPIVLAYRFEHAKKCSVRFTFLAPPQLLLRRNLSGGVINYFCPSHYFTKKLKLTTIKQTFTLPNCCSQTLAQQILQKLFSVLSASNTYPFGKYCSFNLPAKYLSAKKSPISKFCFHSFSGSCKILSFKSVLAESV